jgi:transposase
MRRGHPAPRFREDHTHQLDPLRGCPEEMVPEGHLARQVQAWVRALDTRALEAEYSSLGRHGIQPRNLLAVWVYASLVGMHYATEVVRALATDHAFWLLSGGHTVKETTLRTFRREHGAFLAQAVGQTVQMAHEQGLLDPQQLAVDSVRLQADASNASLRTRTRSTARLAALAEVDTATLSPEAQMAHAEKLAKHQVAIEHCDTEGCSSYSTTTPSAALLKFPSGAAWPGHRLTVTACRSDLRMVVSVLINATPNDFGLLEAAVTQTRANLSAAGLPEETRLQVAADAGYSSKADLAFAEANESWVDLLVAEPPEPARGKKARPGGFFGRDRFQIHDDGSATCPAGRAMQGPSKQGKHRRMWTGEGCASCALKAACTNAKVRTLNQDPEADRLHQAMRTRLAAPGAQARYHQRIAIVEPVFAYLEDVMGYRRASSRLTATVQAEIWLKILAYNLLRLHTVGAVVSVCVSLAASPAGIRILAAWIPLWPSATTPEHPRAVLLQTLS